MLKANVGLSRKISRDFNSTGYSVNIEGEIAATVDDPNVCLERVRELFNLAEEALNQEMDRDQGEQAIGRRDEERQRSDDHPVNRDDSGRNWQSRRESNATSNGAKRDSDEPATNKQVQYLLSIGKRKHLSKSDLENRIENILGNRLGVYDLSKKEAGQVIDLLTQDDNGQRNGRR